MLIEMSTNITWFNLADMSVQLSIEMSINMSTEMSTQMSVNMSTEQGFVSKLLLSRSIMMEITLAFYTLLRVLKRYAIKISNKYMQ